MPPQVLVNAQISDSRRAKRLHYRAFKKAHVVGFPLAVDSIVFLVGGPHPSLGFEQRVRMGDYG
jgi:hypothetical protein